MEQIVLHYGVIAIFLGAGIEGEPFALAGGILAHRDWLHGWVAAGAASTGAAAIDQLWFHLSRRFRNNRRIRAIAARPGVARCRALLERYPVGFVLLFRFAYGLRAVAPVAIGLSNVSAWLFVPVDLLAAAAWGSGFTALGFLMGAPFERAEQRYGPEIGLAAIAISALALALVLRRGNRS